jgi:hypothetical protein
VTGWFELLADNPIAGLIDLDLLLVVHNLLLVAIALATYVALCRMNPSATTIALGLWLFSLVLLIAATPAIEMLSLSDRFAAAASDAEPTGTLAAGEGLLATWEGTAFQVSYVVGQLAGMSCASKGGLTRASICSSRSVGEPVGWEFGPNGPASAGIPP